MIRGGDGAPPKKSLVGARDQDFWIFGGVLAFGRVGGKIWDMQVYGSRLFFWRALLCVLALASVGKALARTQEGSGLVFDSQTKEYDAKPFETSAPFTYYLTNTSARDIIINTVKASCGCTTVSLPPTPWTLHPGEEGSVKAKVNLALKMGTFVKTLTFETSAGVSVVNLKVVIPSPEDPAGAGGPDRQAAMAVATADRQAVFRGDCARCHADKGRALLGADLYAADCGICHESPHRASVVPDLHALKEPTSIEFWKTFITYGKPHTLMPAFAMAQGGPLTDQQILSLAGYLNRIIPSREVPPLVTNSAALRVSRFASQP